MDYKVLLFLFGFFAFSSGKAIHISQGEVGKWRMMLERGDTQTLAALNDIADSIIQTVDDLLIMNGMDPAQLEDIHKSFEYKPLLITYHGELDLTDGWLQDLSTLYRTGDVALTLTGNGDVILTVPLGFDDLAFSYDYSAKIMNLGPTGVVGGKAASIKAEIQLRYVIDDKKFELQLFKITSTGKISLKFSGNGLLDWMVNLFTSVVTTVLHDLIVKVAENVVRNNIDTILDIINSGLSN